MPPSVPSKFGVSDDGVKLQQHIATIRRKNAPILFVGTFCAVILFVALTVSIFLYIQICGMDDELKLGAAEFKGLSDQSWQMLFHDDGQSEGFGGRVERGAYFPSIASPPSQKCQCAPSAQNCPPGHPGAPGEKGEDGVPGPPGKPGPVGQNSGQFEFEPVKPPCVLCPAGPPGVKGRPGLAGVPGPIGGPGENGRPGADAKPGSKGTPGDYGPAGPNGPTGPPGPPGTDVNSWARVGTKGGKGPSGPPGPSGDAGQPGTNGEPGQNGASGAPGQIGLRGDDGRPGKAGNRGSPGKTSPDANYCPCPPRLNNAKSDASAAVYAQNAPALVNKFNFRARADLKGIRSENEKKSAAKLGEKTVESRKGGRKVKQMGTGN